MSRCRPSRSRLHLPEDLVREILLRLPAKSVGMFRCVSTAWLSISTDPCFILAHARRAPKYFLVESRQFGRRGNIGHCIIPAFRRSAGGIGKQRFDQIEATSSCEIKTMSSCEISDQVMSSCDGLLCLWSSKPHGTSTYYVQNPLTGLRIDLPNPESMSKLQMYFHGPTGEYRLLNLSQHSRPNYHLKAVVLSLVGRLLSEREIKIGIPYVTDFNQQSSVLVNDCLYWTCRHSSPPKSIAILVFNTLKESFSLMEPPCNGQFFTIFFENYGLVDIDGELGYWTTELYNSRSVVQVEIWTPGNGDQDWKNMHSLCLTGDAAVCIPSDNNYLECIIADFVEGELLCLFDGRVVCLLHWDLKSGSFYIEKPPISINNYAHIYKETLNMPSTPPTMP